MRPAIALSAITVGALAAWAAGAKDKAEPARPDARPLVIHLDAGKLPPDLLRRLLEAARPAAGPVEVREPTPKGKGKARRDEPPPAPAAKAISLIDAIKIAEKQARGEAVKAERKGDGPELKFKVDVLTSDGKRTKVELTAAGKIIEKDKEPEKGRD
jgi:hypothetical protein